jgi:perosamine synthetase
MYPIIRPYFKFYKLLKLFNIFTYFTKTKICSFEKEFANLIGRKYAISFSSGRVALQRFLESSNIKNENIILPSYTCIVVPFAVELSNNKPKFIEQSNNFVPSYHELKKDVSKYMILTHMFGEVNPIDQNEKDIFIIEDACLAIGSEVDGQKAGTIGDISFFSFNQSKQISCYDGGMLLTDDKDIYNKLKVLQSDKVNFKEEIKHVLKVFIYHFYFKKTIYTFAKKASLFFGIKSQSFSIESCEVDRKFNKDFLVSQAILGLQQLDDLEYILKERKKIANLYHKYLSGLNCQKRPKISKDGYELSHYWIILNNNRKSIMNELKNRGINTGYANEYSCPTTPYYNFDVKKYQKSTNTGENIINLPFYIGLNENDIQYISKQLKDICAKY